MPVTKTNNNERFYYVVPGYRTQMRHIMRGVEEIIHEVELRRMLTKSAQTGLPLRVKLGVDPLPLTYIWAHGYHQKAQTFPGYGTHRYIPDRRFYSSNR